MGLFFRELKTIDRRFRPARASRGLGRNRELIPMIQPDFREFQRLAKQGNLIPVYDVFSADLLTPVSAYLRIAQGARYSFLLESVEGGEKIARYTFAAAHPEEVFRYANGPCVLQSRDRTVSEERDPISFLRHRTEPSPPARLPCL